MTDQKMPCKHLFKVRSFEYVSSTSDTTGMKVQFYCKICRAVTTPIQGSVTLDGTHAVKKGPTIDEALACVHRGESAGTVRCSACSDKNVQIKLFACEIHGQCTLMRKEGEIQCCSTCPDIKPPETPQINTVPMNSPAP